MRGDGIFQTRGLVSQCPALAQLRNRFRCCARRIYAVAIDFRRRPNVSACMPLGDDTRIVKGTKPRLAA
jgi:hypothetical protein